MGITPELIADYQCVTGEGPIWHPDEGRVYWVDIPQGRMFRYDPATGHHEQCYEGDAIGGFTLQADGSLLLFMGQGAVRVWREGLVKTIVEEIPGEADSRFNDVIADPMGRVYCGTMSSPTHKGRLYRLDVDGSPTTILEGVGTSNGMGFTPGGKHMYHTDSREREIYRFDYDMTSGQLSNRIVFVRTPDDEGVPDGMTVDAEGFVWGARWDGGCLVRYAPDGSEDMRIAFPAKKVSSVIFGGPDYTDLYVTTAGGHDKDENGPGAGGLFRINLGIRGVPEFRSRIGL